ncbi:MAG: ribose-phosphate diphosphokinase [Thiohalobacteraceae bacterium]
MINPNKTLLLGFPDYAPQTRALATALGVPYAEIALHRFPDGESRLRLPASLPPKVLLCRSLDDPNAKLVELLFAAGTARELGAVELTLVAPYLCYMRQDRAFHPGEAVSQRQLGRFLAEQFDAVITVDAHLHRVHRLADAVPVEHALNLSAAALLGRYAAQRFDDPLLLGPDEESAQWVEAAARADGLDSAVARKHRSDDRRVSIALPDVDLRGRTVVLVDDIASTGHTLARAAEAVYAKGASAVHALVCHALFVEDAEAQLQRADIRSLHSTDSISHPTNAIGLAELLAGACKKLLRN